MHRDVTLFTLNASTFIYLMTLRTLPMNNFVHLENGQSNLFENVTEV